MQVLFHFFNGVTCRNSSIYTATYTMPRCGITMLGVYCEINYIDIGNKLHRYRKLWEIK